MPECQRSNRLAPRHSTGFANTLSRRTQLATQGYASVRADMRGSGSSDGVLMDEYSEQEMQDGENVLRWIAQQNWCDGNIGMIGISWGDVTGLQLASRYAQPARLSQP